MRAIQVDPKGRCGPWILVGWFLRGLAWALQGNAGAVWATVWSRNQPAKSRGFGLLAERLVRFDPDRGTSV
ncbi:hypothetical protein GUJ93_ZPchr0458g22433 [Zizania palustris]|uniref:Uncharacterized protein n=1 Tax=Zizania palustris TaxID=103762 RepID=A0A8J5QV02_ZIZPA|nr:hypothetical protein GUJ93_ZPchr0458g22433 [Zizania palustris]